MDADDIVKEIKIQQTMGVPIGQRPRCLRCGARVPIYEAEGSDFAAGETYTYDSYCGRCARKQATVDDPVPEPTMCRYCCNAPRLPGMAWCAPCRDNYQKKVAYESH